MQNLAQIWRNETVIPFHAQYLIEECVWEIVISLRKVLWTVNPEEIQWALRNTITSSLRTYIEDVRSGECTSISQQWVTRDSMISNESLWVIQTSSQRIVTDIDYLLKGFDLNILSTHIARTISALTRWYIEDSQYLKAAE